MNIEKKHFDQECISASVRVGSGEIARDVTQLENVVRRIQEYGHQAEALECKIVDLLERLNGPLPRSNSPACSKTEPASVGLVGDAHLGLDAIGGRLSGCREVLEQIRGLV